MQLTRRLVLAAQKGEPNSHEAHRRLILGAGRLLMEAILVSKKQAAAVGDALAQGKRSRRTSLPYRLRFYPELSKIPLDDRDDALSDAKVRAMRSAPVIVASFLFPSLFVAMYFSREPGSDWLGPFMTALVVLTSIWGVVFRWCVRRKLLHSDWRPRPTALSELVRTPSDN